MNERAEINANALQAFETLTSFLEEDGWYPQRLDDRYIHRMGFSGANGQYACYAQIRMDLEQFLFYVMAPVKVPEERRMLCAEFLTRANYGLRIGNFEMDMSDGEVRYKSSLDFEGEALTPNLIRRAIYPAVQTMDRYMPGLMKVMYGAATPEVAIGEIEG
ncbi:MAG: YbjN domain-containing protein [Anaerolineae bacterium]